MCNVDHQTNSPAVLGGDVFNRNGWEYETAVQIEVVHTTLKVAKALLSGHHPPEHVCNAPRPFHLSEG